MIHIRPAASLITALLGSFMFLLPWMAAPQETVIGDTLTLDEVGVFGKRVSIYPAEPIILTDFAYEPIRDIGDFLRQEPNLSGIRKGGIAIDPVVRGFRYNQVTVLLNDGVKIEGGCPNRMDPVASHVETENISRIELVKGPFVLKYGPVMGALINIRSIQPEFHAQPAVHGKLLYGFESNWNGQREHLELAGGTRNVSFLVSGGFKGYGSYTAGNGEVFNTSFRKSYVTAATGFKIKEKHHITLSYAYDQGNDVRFPALPMDEQLDKTHVASVNYELTGLSPEWTSFQAMGYLSSVHHVMDNFDRPTAAVMQAVTTVDALDAGGKAAGTFQSGEWKILAGADYEHIYKDGQKKMTMKMVMGGDTFTSVKYTNVFNQSVLNNAGVFGEVQSRFGGIDFTAALRFDYNHVNSADTFHLVRDGVSYFDKLNSDFLNVSFSAGIKKRLVSELFFTAALGLGTRSPSILERFIKLMPVQFDSYDYLGNPQLKPEQNWQADLSLDYYLPDIGSFKANGFISLVHHYILGKVVPPSVIKPSTQGVIGVKQFSNVDLAYLTGFEFSYASPTQKKWGVMVNAAATYGTNPKAVKYLVSDGEVVGEEIIYNDPLPEIPPLEGSLHVWYQFFGKKLVPRATVRLVNAQNRISEAYGEQKTPGFATASCSLSYTPCSFFMLTGGVENIFDNAYYEHLNRRIVGSQQRLYEPGRVFYINLAIQF